MSMPPGGDEDDRTIRLWDLSNGDELLCVEPQDAGLLSIAPFPDGRRCATTGNELHPSPGFRLRQARA